MKKKRQRGPKENKKKASNFKEQKHDPVSSSDDKPGQKSTASLEQGYKSNRADEELDKLISNKSARKYPAASRRYK